MSSVTRGIKTKIQLDGEAEFKQSISEINSGIGVLDSELRKLKSQYQDNADSVEFLTKQGDVLERKLYSQKEKVEEYRKKLQELKETNGEANEETMQMEKRLNQAETAMYDTEAAIRRNNSALEDIQKGTQTTGVSFKTFAVGAVAAIGTIAAAVKALIDVEQKLIDLTREAASGADEILTLTQITGLNSDTIQEMQYAAELIDVSFETIQGSMTKMKRNMDSARDGNEKLIQSFEDLGVSITDSNGELRNSEDVFFDAIDALGKIENATERDAAAMAIFGKSAEDLNPLIIQGSDTLRAYAEEAHNMSAVLTEEELASLGAVDDAYQRMIQTQDAAKNQIAVELAPVVSEFYEAWGEFIKEAAQAFIDSGLLDMLKDMLQSFTEFLQEVTGANEEGLPNLEQRFSTLKTVIYDVALLFAAIKDTITALVNFNPIGILNGSFGDAIGLGYSEGRANSYQTTKMRQEGRYGQYAEYYGLNASGDSNFRGGYTWVGENGPELVSLPTGTSISTAQDSRNMGTNNYYITIDAKNVKEFNDIVEMAQNSRVASRMRG